MSFKKTALVLAAAIVSVTLSGLVLAQDSQPAGGDNPGRGGRGGRGNFDPAQFMKDRMDHIKTTLGATDDEWKVLQPKIEKIGKLAMQTRGMGMGMGRGGRGGQDATLPADAPDTQKKFVELKKVLDNKDSKKEDIIAALTAYREAKAKAQADLVAAQKELKDILTARQEAECVTLGLID